MKIRTSIAVDKALLEKADKLSSHYRNRSEFIEAALRAYIARGTQNENKSRDLEIINRRASNLNREALDVLDYQITL